MINLEETLPIEGLAIDQDALIKVMGVGGGGCNAVNYLYRQGIEGVSFLVCNTDRQQLAASSVPAKLQLGPGLGAGGNPEVARGFAEQNRDTIREALNDGTKMLFITAGQGGGTGTGASPVVAEVARDLGILTVAIVTIPFAFEGQPKIYKAMTGIAHLSEQVDALLVLNNEKLCQIYPSLNFITGFAKSDDVVANAARAIAEIITVPGYINTDFQDVYNTLKNGKVAIMNVGRASGENRITHAIADALNSPLIKTSDVQGAKRVLLQLYCSQEHAILMEEFSQVHQFVAEVGEGVEVQWGVSIDDSLGEDVRITIIATGYEVNDIPSLTDVVGQPTIEEAADKFYQKEEPAEQKPEEAAAEEAPAEEEKKAEEEEEMETITIDLTGEIQSEPAATAAAAATRSAGSEPEQLEIQIDDVPEEKNEKPNPSTNEGFGLLRNWFHHD